jgi:para-aminobenzoate synthetase component 1
VGGSTVGQGAAWFGGVLAEGVREVSTDPAELDRGGWWAVVASFEGELSMWRFDRVRPAPLPPGRPVAASAWPLGAPGLASPAEVTTGWPGIAAGEWKTSLGRASYVAGVKEIRRRIREGEVYQVNLCRVMSAPVPPDADPWALAALLATGNPAPYVGVIDVPGVSGMSGAKVVSASPELFLARDGDVVRSGPIKGTAPTATELLPKDEAENVMIVDLVRNDLQRVCRAGTVAVPDLLALEQHPGLVHLVSTVEGRLLPGVGWVELLAATMPPGSVSGAPKISALRVIEDLEPVPRGPYCGAVGWVDADRARGCLAVGIRTFWWGSGRLCFGTGAGITWGSDAEQEWEETELKARRLVGLTRPASDADAGAADVVRVGYPGGRGTATTAGRSDPGSGVTAIPP